jgi:hypothetical protein
MTLWCSANQGILAIGDCSGKQIEIIKARTGHCEEESKGHLRILSFFRPFLYLYLLQSPNQIIISSLALSRKGGYRHAPAWLRE